MRLITILNLLSLLFTPLNTLQASGVGGENTLIEPFKQEYNNMQLLGIATREMNETGDGAQPSYVHVDGDDYCYFVSTYYLVNSDAPDLHDLIITTTIPSYCEYSNVWDFTILSLDNKLSNNDVFLFDTFDTLSFSYTLKSDITTSNNQLVNYYYIDTDFLISSYNYMIFRCSLDYYENMFTGDSYNAYVYGSWSSTYLNSLESDVLLPSFAWIPNNIISGGDYTTGFNDGVKSVDTDIYYQQGVDSVNVDAIYANAYNDGYNVGITESSHDYGIGNLLFSIFDIPIMVMSSLFSFTIFGTEVWGLLVSLMFVAFILLVTAKILGRTSD